MKEFRILLVHGVGHKEAEPGWNKEWETAIKAALKKAGSDATPVFATVEYDDLFAESDLDPAIIAEAVAKLLASGVVHGIGDIFRGDRGLFDPIRWTAGMVAQWTADEELRSKNRQCLKEKMNAFKPDIICAHSLGSLICYDLFRRDEEVIRNRRFISLGSQIGNPFVRSVFGGRIEKLGAQFWHHLYNREDDVMTAPIRLSAGNFEQVTTFFDIPGFMDHDPVEYLSHPNTIDRVWRTIARPEPPKLLSRAVTNCKEARKPPEHRALLVGINEYPIPQYRLNGCVNDVYLMSSVIQELGFPAENVRIVLNERATASNIQERLEWLLQDAGEGDYRFFYYSGHGAQIPAYGAREEVDRMDECLVPYDFNWTQETTVTDDTFCTLYSQLPYETNFIAVFDCCHAGGMTRDGSVRVRGLDPPDDIRHRMLKWDPKRKTWAPRKLGLSDKSLVAAEKNRVDFIGESGAVRRLGRATPLWTSPENYTRALDEYRHKGPYVPILLEACREGQLAAEYRHGATSHGAFTWCLAENLRRSAGKGGLTWQQLREKTKKAITELGFSQSPVLVCPGSRKTAPISFLAREEGSEQKK